MSAPFLLVFAQARQLETCLFFRDRSTIFLHATIITHIFSKLWQTFCHFALSIGVNAQFVRPTLRRRQYSLQPITMRALRNVEMRINGIAGYVAKISQFD